MHIPPSLAVALLFSVLLFTAAGFILYRFFSSRLNETRALNKALEEKIQELELVKTGLEKTVRKKTDDLAATDATLLLEIKRRQGSEASLQAATKQWHRTFDAIGDAVLILDPDLTIVKGNAAAMKLLGNGAGTTILGRKCYKLFAGNNQICEDCPLREVRESGKPCNRIMEQSFLGKVFQTGSVPLMDHGDLLGYIFYAHDISFQRKLEQQLVQTRKMEAIATLAGGIAHDFNNILGAILGNADLLLYRLTKAEEKIVPSAQKDITPHEISEHVDAIKKAGLRAKVLVSQILAFSRQKTASRQRIDITPVIKEGIKLLRSSLPTAIEVKGKISSNIGLIDTDPTQIHQVLMNLTTNAAQAIGNKPGRITIRLQQIDAGQEECRRYHDLVPGAYVVLSVKDTGPGIPEGLLKRIFDPFFTTRDVGEGTGMGLSVVHGIVVSHDGIIDVSAPAGEGAEFTVFFPRVAAEKQKSGDVVTNMPLGDETLLFVDDEEDIVKMRRRMLEYLGYKVLAAGDGVEALTIYRENQEKIDLVITDQTMPKMTGLKLAEKIHAIDDEIPIILCSGYSDAVTTEEANRAGIRRFLAKPLDMRRLSISIRELLPSGGA